MTPSPCRRRSGRRDGGDIYRRGLATNGVTFGTSGLLSLGAPSMETVRMLERGTGAVRGCLAP